MKRMIKTILLVCALGWLVVSFAVQAQQDDGLPESNGVVLVRAQCLNCHEADLITSQRLSKPGWTREVEKMVRWGAVVKDADKEPMIDYLTRHFGAKPFTKQPATVSVAPSEAVLARGKSVFENKCLLCHEADLTEQQRLSRVGWTREVEKMMRWGAVVTDVEKEPLVDYLSTRFPPRKK